MKCRHCAASLDLRFVDLGAAPPSNSYLTESGLSQPEPWFPLRVLTCTNCWLVQTEDFAAHDEMFSGEYAYFSSFSTGWLQHAETYVDKMVSRFHLNDQSMIVEIAANDGYLLQFAKARGLKSLGVEPTASTASAARARGVEIVEEFFGVALAERLAKEGHSADLMTANNVLAHVPDINDFVAGFAILLKSDGVATFEFPHLMKLVSQNQFDTIYHEHFSYLSLTSVTGIFEANGLTVFDVEEISTHGGSLRVFARRSDSQAHPVLKAVAGMLNLEATAGVTSASYYASLQGAAEQISQELLTFLLEAKSSGKTVAAYGAAAKGNTLLNFAGIRPNLIPWVVDRNPAKQGKYLPGSRIPIVDESRLGRDRPDFVIVLPWNLQNEVKEQLAYIREWGGKFVCAVPSLSVL